MISYDEARVYAESIGASYMEISAYEGYNIDTLMQLMIDHAIDWHI